MHVELVSESVDGGQPTDPHRWNLPWFNFTEGGARLRRARVWFPDDPALFLELLYTAAGDDSITLHGLESDSRGVRGAAVGLLRALPMLREIAATGRPPLSPTDEAARRQIVARARKLKNETRMTWPQIAGRLGVSPSSLRDWRKKFPPES